MDVLFYSQGRAVPNVAMGHVRVVHALEAGLPALTEVGAAYDSLRPFTLAERILVRRAPGQPDWDLGTLRWHLVRGWAARRDLARRLDAGRPDVVHMTTNQISLLLGRLHRRVPMVMSLDIPIYHWIRLLRRLPEEGPMPPDLRPLVALERRALHRAPLTIPWTETVARQVSSIAPAARTVAPLHPGIDLETYAPSAGRRRGGPVRILFVGGRWTVKGGPELLAALDDVLGHGVELDVVTSADLPARPGLRVHKGSPGSTGVLELFQRADVLCLPTYVDAAPWVVVEALATGVPVVATRIGSIPELVGDGGVTVEAGDAEGLRTALHTLVEQPDRRRELGEAGRARAELHYNARANTRRLVETLADVVARTS